MLKPGVAMPPPLNAPHEDARSALTLGGKVPLERCFALDQMLVAWDADAGRFRFPVVHDFLVHLEAVALLEAQGTALRLSISWLGAEPIRPCHTFADLRRRAPERGAGRPSTLSSLASMPGGDARAARLTRLREMGLNRARGHGIAAASGRRMRPWAATGGDKMARSLPAAEIVRKFIDEAFDPHSPVMALRWPEAEGRAERLWELPEGLCVAGSAPARFGYSVRRHAADSYTVRVAWDRTVMSWTNLPRVEILGSCLGSLLAALGIDLWSVLEQPVPGARSRHRAA